MKLNLVFIVHHLQERPSKLKLCSKYFCNSFESRSLWLPAEYIPAELFFPLTSIIKNLVAYAWVKHLSHNTFTKLNFSIRQVIFEKHSRLSLKQSHYWHHHPATGTWHNTHLFCFGTASASKQFHPHCPEWPQSQGNTGPSRSKPILSHRTADFHTAVEQVWNSERQAPLLLRLGCSVEVSDWIIPTSVGEFEETRQMVLWPLLLKKIEKKKHRGLKLSLGGTCSPFTQSLVFSFSNTWMVRECNMPTRSFIVQLFDTAHSLELPLWLPSHTLLSYKIFL